MQYSSTVEQLRIQIERLVRIIIGYHPGSLGQETWQEKEEKEFKEHGQGELSPEA